MTEEWPRITARRREAVSPWLNVIIRDVQFSPETSAETYYAIGQADFLVALALTPEGRIVLVRQYRPALERMSLELPAGMLDPGEQPAAAIVRELAEETGYAAASIDYLGAGATCSSRISNTTHSFFIRTGERAAGFVEEPGVAVSFATPAELRALVVSGEFCEQTHLGVLALAVLRGVISF